MYGAAVTPTALDDLYDGTSNLSRIRSLKTTRTVSAESMAPGLTIAVLNLNRPDLVIPLIRSFPLFAPAFAGRGLGLELIIGDTGSTDPDVLVEYRNLPEGVSVVPGLAYQFSRSNNDICDGRVLFDHLLLLNNDVILRTAEPLLMMLECMEGHPEAGIVGAVLDLPNGKLQHAGVDVVREGPYRGIPIHFGARAPWQHQEGRSWPAIAATGAALMIRTEIWQALGGLDEGYQRECQDVDLCLRAHRLGHETRVIDTGRLVHEENGTRPIGEEDWPDRRLFLRRWRSYLEAVYL